ncbi:uncharacterized protein METZ01_LOCUS490835, partial [marine metagenome]
MRSIKFVFPLRFLILLSIIILLSGGSEAATERDPEYSFTTTSYTVYSTISDDTRYTAAIDDGGKIYYYNTLNHTELWSYDTGTTQLRDLDIS